ncbi:MAG TPA: c-type cytochrome [candidate division Zixibacteria bacterium]|nr:c-type cytochrome [candidate division Zixibacteria bacterium]
MCYPSFIILFAILFLQRAAEGAFPSGDPARGAVAFRQCDACHSLEPGVHLTGPSLAQVLGRKAGTAEGFRRYSDALKRSGIVWNERALHEFLKDPQSSIPGNLMPFPGIRDDRQRADLVAYLKAADTGSESERAPRGGGMAGPPTDLKKLGKKQQVRSIRYCGDTYHVTTASGETLPFWEFNLRFKTDSSRNGPPKGTPALIRAGMMGDRAFIVFSSAEEMVALIESRC